MTSAHLADGRMLHFPGFAPSEQPGVLLSTPIALSDDAVRELVPLIDADQLLLFAKRLVDGARKRRLDERYAEVNCTRLFMARLCLDRALAEGHQH